jgi:alpha-tubulin suppressor-like RCC1 family protein
MLKAFAMGASSRASLTLAVAACATAVGSILLACSDGDIGSSPGVRPSTKSPVGTSTSSSTGGPNKPGTSTSSSGGIDDEPDGGPDTPTKQAPRMAVGVSHSCAILPTGQLKCFGSNGSGELGLGDTKGRGDATGQMGNALPTVSLGTGRTAKQVSLGYLATCAVLDNGGLKCWGSGTFGKLGQGDSLARGKLPTEMGDALKPIDLGGAVTQVVMGDFHVCGLLQGGSVKCWGSNMSGELGLGDTNDRGDGPGEMGAALKAVQFGAGRTATHIAVGNEHTCVLLDNGQVKCWGHNDQGQLGIGSLVDKGALPGDMGDALAGVQFGTGRVALQLCAGSYHSCVLLDNGSTKCWGANTSGQLGSGDTAQRGSAAGQMGDNLPAVSLGTGRRAKLITCGGFSTCALLDDDSVKCWGSNASGQLGLGNTTGHGDSPARIGDNLAAVSLGQGRKVVNLSSREHHVCVALDDLSIKCWGKNDMGQLGLGDKQARGTLPAQMGDSLKPVILE